MDSKRILCLLGSINTTVQGDTKDEKIQNTRQEELIQTTFFKQCSIAITCVYYFVLPILMMFYLFCKLPRTVE